MRVIIEFDTDNTAFHDEAFAFEVDRVLTLARWKLEEWSDLQHGDRAEAPLRDSNGNTIGSVKVTS